MQPSPLVLNGVTKQFGSQIAVNDLSFTVPAGSICGFLGPNGAGKTTSLRMILDIIRPDAGSITLFGGQVTDQARMRVGFLPEERGLYRKMKARDVIAFYGRLKGMSGGEARKRAIALLDQYGLGDAATRKIKDLSKGMAQKVQILASIVHQPAFLILDEPFSGLDPVNQQLLERLIADTREGGTTIMFSTHVMEHAERLCDKIVLLSKGRKVFDGTVDEALHLLPRHAEYVLTDQCDPTRLALEGVHLTCMGAEEDGVRWRAEFSGEANAQSTLSALLAGGLKLRGFDNPRPHLHDAFVMLVHGSGDKGEAA
jgi:ABC-2 type transport system ATP-binding protein